MTRKAILKKILKAEISGEYKFYHCYNTIVLKKRVDNENESTLTIFISGSLITITSELCRHGIRINSNTIFAELIKNINFFNIENCGDFIYFIFSSFGKEKKFKF